MGHDKEDLDCCCELYEPGPERKMIQSFSSEGKPLLFIKDDITGHCPWDMECSCELCADDRFDAWIDSLDRSAYNPSRPGKKKNSTQSEFYKRWMVGDPNIRLLGEDNGKFIYLVDYSGKSTSVSKPISL